MCTFILKSYNQKLEIEKPHFFILNKGNNSGKPLLAPCPNCFVIQCENESEKEQIYWLSYSLWQSKAFYPLLRGSVIPFVISRDVKSCLLMVWIKQKRIRFSLKKQWQLFAVWKQWKTNFDKI